MEFEVLGPLCVRSGSGEPEVRAGAQHGLLAVLLTSPNIAIPDDRLIDELWGDDPPASARHLLQVYASQLRGLLGELADGTRVKRDGQGYLLRVEPGELDSERFEAAIMSSRELRQLDPEAAEQALSHALRLWRGPPFAGVRAPSPAIRDRAAYLERLHVEGLHTWIEARLELGRHRDVVPDLTALVAEHPYDEIFHGQLMLALYRCARQAEALETARVLRDRLRDDLAIEPSKEIGDLYRRILLQAPELDLEPPAPPGNLPSRLSSFVGRSCELGEVKGLVETRRIVTLTGPGGIGKTRLALEVAQRLTPQFPGGAWWIDLAAVADPGMVAEAAARVLGLTVAPEMDVTAAVVRALGRRRALLLLDNCEHVAAGAGELAAAIVVRTTGSHVLATSRTPLHVEGEHLWSVPPLALPAPDASAAEILGSDAVRLFVDRGRAVDPSFAVDAENAQDIVEVCSRLDGLSLAIEMAAARVRVLTPRELLEHLAERLALLELPAVDVPTRHRTLTAALDASHVLLSERDRSVFERLSIFVGPFDLVAAGAVGLGDAGSSAQMVASVAELVEASLLTPEREDETTRYRLLETLREYAAVKLRGGGGEDDARSAHAEYHLGLAVRAGAVLGTPDFASWMRTLARAYGELREALRWSLDCQPRSTTLLAAPALRDFWYRRADAREASRWTALMLAGDLDGVPAGLVAEAHAAAAFGANAANEQAAALAHAEKAILLSREGEYVPGLVFALWARSNVFFALGEMDEMLESAREALAVCDANGDRWGRAGPLSNLGFASLLCGAPDDARAWFEDALPVYRELDDLGGLVLLALAPLSDAALRQGDLRGAERYATEAVELSAGTGWQACALSRYSAVLIELGELAAAEAATLRAIGVALDTGLEAWFRVALRDLARIRCGQDRYRDAALLLAASRVSIPAWGLDPTVYGPVEARCREVLGLDEFDRLTVRGETMSHDELRVSWTASEHTHGRSERRVPAQQGPI